MERQIVYEGPGALAEGFLMEGLLAERWILNAISSLTAKPKLVKGLFVATGQEDRSRYCLRLFEGSSWRNVFIDDNIPIGPNNQPLFAKSSDPSECWVMLVSKAIGKYLGSYGHVGKYAIRSDAMDMALRWFTGGHIIRKATSDFQWVPDETER